MIQNTQRRILNIWYLITLAILVCVFLPSLFGVFHVSDPVSIPITAGFLTLMGLFLIFIYRSRAHQLDKILSGEGRLATWHYSPDDWMRFAEADYAGEKKIKKSRSVPMVALMVAIAVSLVVVLRQPVIIPMVAGSIAIVSIPLFLVPWLRFRKLQRSEAEVVIAETGVIIGKMVHLWGRWRTHVERVSINTSNNPNCIEFVYSIPTRYGRRKVVARVPVPKGKNEDAVRIVKHFERRRDA